MAVNTAERGAELAAEREANYRALYGKHLADANFLRRKGFVVTKDEYGFVIDGKNVDVETFKAIVDREKTREGAVSVTNGHAEPAAEACKCGKPLKHMGNCWHRRGLTGPPQKGASPRAAAEGRQPARRTVKPRQASTAKKTASADPIDAALDHLKAQLTRIQGAIVALEMAKEALANP